MMYVTRLSILLVCLLHFGVVRQTKEPRIAIEKTKTNWEGYYAVEGEENNRTYHGICVIQKYGGELSQSFTISTTVDKVTVIGIAQERQGLLCVGWTGISSDGSTAKGCTVLVRKNNQVAGTWVSLPGDGTLRTERYTFLRSIDPAPKDGG